MQKSFKKFAQDFRLFKLAPIFAFFGILAALASNVFSIYRIIGDPNLVAWGAVFHFGYFVCLLSMVRSAQCKSMWGLVHLALAIAALYSTKQFSNWFGETNAAISSLYQWNLYISAIVSLAMIVTLIDPKNAKIFDYFLDENYAGGEGFARFRKDRRKEERRERTTHHGGVDTDPFSQFRQPPDGR